METSQNYISEKIRNSSNTVINPATEEKQDDIITALGNISIDADSVNLNTDGLEALGTAGNASLSSIDTKQSTIIGHVDGIEGQITTTNNLGSVRIVRDATLGGTPSYTNINTNNSVVSIDTAGTTVTGGREIISYQLAGKNDRIAEKLLEMKIVLQDGETFTVAVSSTNSATFTGSLLWKELF